MWDVFSLTDPHNKEKKWDLLLHKYRFNLEYEKHHVKSLQKSSKADKYMVQKLTWSGMDLRSTSSSAIIQKVLKLVPLTATGPEIYVTTMIFMILWWRI